MSPLRPDGMALNADGLVVDAGLLLDWLNRDPPIR